MDKFLQKYTAWAIILIALSFVPAQAEDSVSLYQCFAKIRLRGELNDVDRTLDRLSKVLNIQNRIHAMTAQNEVQVQAIASVSDLDLKDAKSRVSADNIKMYLSVIHQPLTGAEVVFLGCSEATLQK